MYRAAHGYQSYHTANGDIYTAAYHNYAHAAAGYYQCCICIKDVKEHLRFRKSAALKEDSSYIHDEEDNYGYHQQQIGVAHFCKDALFFILLIHLRHPLCRCFLFTA